MTTTKLLLVILIFFMACFVLVIILIIRAPVFIENEEGIPVPKDKAGKTTKTHKMKRQ